MALEWLSTYCFIRQDSVFLQKSLHLRVNLDTASQTSVEGRILGCEWQSLSTGCAIVTHSRFGGCWSSKFLHQQSEGFFFFFFFFPLVLLLKELRSITPLKKGCLLTVSGTHLSSCLFAPHLPLAAPYRRKIQMFRRSAVHIFLAHDILKGHKKDPDFWSVLMVRICQK